MDSVFLIKFILRRAHPVPPNAGRHCAQDLEKDGREREGGSTGACTVTVRRRARHCAEGSRMRRFSVLETYMIQIMHSKTTTKAERSNALGDGLYLGSVSHGDEKSK